LSIITTKILAGDNIFVKTEYYTDRYMFTALMIIKVQWISTRNFKSKLIQKRCSEWQRKRTKSFLLHHITYHSLVHQVKQDKLTCLIT